MSDFEPGDTMIDALRRANPVPTGSTGSRRERPSAHALFAEIVAEPPRRLRRRVLVIAIVVALIASLLAAFVYVRHESASLPLSTACYAADSLSAPKVVTTSSPDPASDCARLWDAGQLGNGPTPSSFDTCVLPSGVVGVFPGESGSVCAGLGLPEASIDPGPLALTHEINDRVNAMCMGESQAEQTIATVMTERGVTGWTIKPSAEHIDPPNTCATLYFVPSARTITIVAQQPFAPAPSSATSR